MVVSCERLSLEFNDIRFVYKGHCVLAEDTPDQACIYFCECSFYSDKKERKNAVFTMEFIKSD